MQVSDCMAVHVWQCSHCLMQRMHTSTLWHAPPGQTRLQIWLLLACIPYVNTPRKRDLAFGASCGEKSTLGLNNCVSLNLSRRSPASLQQLMLGEPNLLPYSAHPFHIQRELCKGCATGVWFGSCVIAHDQPGAHVGPDCSACHLAELWGRFS